MRKTELSEFGKRRAEKKTLGRRRTTMRKRINIFFELFTNDVMVLVQSRILTTNFDSPYSKKNLTSGPKVGTKRDC